MNKCKSCKFRAASQNPWTCEYIFIVGHSRGCEPGNKCTVYEKGSRILLPQATPTFLGYIPKKKM